MSATALQIFEPPSLIALQMFSESGDSAKKYKTAVFKPKPTKFGFFCQVPRSPIHTGLICGKTLEQNTVSQAWAPLLVQKGWL
jgi:hypothetical protein